MKHTDENNPLNKDDLSNKKEELEKKELPQEEQQENGLCIQASKRHYHCSCT